MATTAQIQQALQAAQAAGNADDVQALRQALQQSQAAPQSTQPPPSGPTREQLSNAFYAAKQAGNEDDARQLIGYIQQHGMTLAPMNADQANAAFQKANAANVAAQNPLLTMWQGVGEGASNFYGGIKQHVYDPIADSIDGGDRSAQAQQQVAQNRTLAQALNSTTAGKAGNFIGSAASAAPLMLIPGGGASIAGRLALGAGTGALSGYLAPSTSDSETVANTLLGGATGMAAPALAGAGRMALRGAATPEARQLIDAGVSLTPGQTVGGALKRIEDGLTSVPLVGDVIRNAQRRSIQSFNTAAMNEALSPLGITVPKNIPAGRDSINFGVDATRNAYDNALGGTSTVADTPLMASLAQRFNGLPARVQDKVSDVLQSRVFPAINESGGTLNGQQFKEMTSGVLGDKTAMARSTDPVERNAANALGGVLDDFKAAFARSNGPEAAAKLADADSAYRGFLQLQDAASHDAQGANGVFTPAQFRAAVRRGDASKGKAAFARGNAYMQDLADTAASVLPRTVPDSGTPYRMFVGAGSLGGVGSLASLAGLGSLSHATLPAAALMGAAAVPYTRAGGRVAQALLAPQIGPVRAGALSLADYLGGYGQSRFLPGLLGVEAAGRDSAAPPIAPALPAPTTFGGN